MNLMTLTLDEGHSGWCSLRDLVVIRFERMRVIVFLWFPPVQVNLTLDEGHIKWYALKGLAKEYHVANFHDCTDDKVRENASVTEYALFSIISYDLA